MRLTTTAALAVIAIVLGVVIHRVDESPATGKRAAELANVLVRFDLEAIDQITVERGVSKAVLIKQEGIWFITEPEEDRADSTLTYALLDRLNHLAIVEDLSASGEGVEPQGIGIVGDHAIRLTLKGKGGDQGPEISETIILGIPAPRTGSIYARREGASPGTFVVDGDPRPWLESPLESLRDRRLLGAPVGAIVQLVLRQESGEIALQRRIAPPQQDWALVAPITSWADREAVDRLVTAIGGLEVEEMIDKGGTPEAIPNPLPKDSVVIQAQIYGIPQALTIYMHKVGEVDDGQPLLEARVSDRPGVYRLKSRFLEELPTSANRLRDRTLARLPVEYLESVRIQSGIDPDVDLRSKRTSQSIEWSLVMGNKLIGANGSQVNHLVSAVNEAAIQEFTSDDAGDLEKYGFGHPQRRIYFTLKLPGDVQEDGNFGPPRELVRILNLSWKEDEERRVYANFDGEPHIYQLDPTFPNLIPTHPLKWRSLNVLTFNPMHLVSITREMPEKEKLRLEYFYREDRWEASRNGLDVTPSIDVLSARRLRDRLGSLTATGWYLSLSRAYEALQTPSVQFNIVVKELDRATNEGKEVTYLMKLAPSTDNLYFGQIEGSPDIFFLNRESYYDLIRSVTTARLKTQ